MSQHLRADLRELFAAALTDCPDAWDLTRQVRPTNDAKFGDYQANMALGLGKERGVNSRALAEQIVEKLPDNSLIAKTEIAGPGFINVTLRAEALAERLQSLLTTGRPVHEPGASGTVVIDYSSPNVAKPMHVGHIRSTIIGEALARLHRAAGWKVISDNHLGDWGLQFGMLIHGWRHYRDEKAATTNPLAELARIYPLVNSLAEKDPAVAEAARRETAKLQAGDPENRALWQTFMQWSLADLARIYQRLDVHFDEQLGESFFDPWLADIVNILMAKGIAVESEGATVIFFPDPSGKTDAEGKPIQRLAPFVIRKGDGAFTYATTDLACVRYRFETHRPSLVVYVVDSRQAMHFEQLFAAVEAAGLAPGCQFIHAGFGTILGQDNKPIKTRDGGIIKLDDLLNEAVKRAGDVVRAESPDLSPEEQERVAEIVGLGAVKYADLSQNRTTDYVFDFDKFLSLRGNTATYLQYMYARTRSILRKAEATPEGIIERLQPLVLAHPAERALALRLLRFDESLLAALDELKPNIWTTYLYDLATTFATFFEQCSVLKADSEASRWERLTLCELTGRTLRDGLQLLGIGTCERL